MGHMKLEITEAEEKQEKDTGFWQVAWWLPAIPLAFRLLVFSGGFHLTHKKLNF